MKNLLMINVEKERTVLPANIESIMYRLENNVAVYALHTDGFWYLLIDNYVVDIEYFRYAYHKLMQYKAGKLDIGVDNRLVE